MRLKVFSSQPSFWEVASGASHDIGARNAIENFSSRPSFGDVASGTSHDIAARNAIEIFQVVQRLDMLRVALVTIVVREMRLNFFWGRPSFEDVASGASHDIGARNAIEIFRSRRCCECRWSRYWREKCDWKNNCIWCQTANNVTSRARKISLKFV